MFYEKYSKLCISCAIFCLSAYIFSPEKGMKVSIAEVSAKEATTTTGSTATGVSIRLSDEWKDDSKQNDKRITQAWQFCDAECKIRELTRLGIRSEISTALVKNCKALANDPVKCLKMWASIVKNESGGGYNCRKYNKYNCFGLQVKDAYKSYDDAVLHWVGKFSKRWYKAQNMGFFYSPAWSLPPSRYCISEDSSNTAIGCPHGLKISTDFYNSLPF